MPAKLSGLLGNSWVLLFLVFASLEAVSFAVFPSIWLSRLAFIIILIIACALTIRKLEFGAYLLLSELVVGGLGYLVTFPLDGGRIPLRIGLFAVVAIIWLVKFLLKQNWKIFNDRRLIPLAIFFAIFLIAIVEGRANGYGLSAVYSDFNGYLYFGLLGLFLSVSLRPIRLMQILIAGTVVSGLLTLLSLFLFSHNLAIVNHSLFYTWIRDTGVGEITLIAAPLYRIFFQSHLFNLLALIFSVFILLFRSSEAGESNIIIDSVSRSRWSKALLWIFAFLNFCVLVISQSRSFWVAGLAILVFALPAAAIYFKISFKRIVPYLLIIPAFAILSNFVGQGIIGDFHTDFLTGRVSGASGSAAVSSRMAELAPAFALIKQAPFFGNGFGTAIRFRSDDPRIKNQSNPEGWTDAVAIEWGYLDLAVKTGILGLLAYLAFLFSLAWPLWQTFLKKDLLATSLLVGLLALMIVHMFTPYLNHPLGIGYLLAIIALTKSSS